jgi:ABC-type transport system involved in cytochrome c biogenesis permease subunit
MSLSVASFESISLWLALVGYSVVCGMAMVGLVFRRRPERTIQAILVICALLHTGAIALRWSRLGHVPVTTPFEMLSANIWSLMIAATIGYWLLPKARVFLAVLMPIVIMLMAWMMLKPADQTSLPPTYDTVWLFIHIGFIKVFMGCAFLALGMSLIVLMRRTRFGQDRLSGLPEDNVLDGRAYRFMALGLIFDSLGIVAGAIWALDAWGRYWSWDPLETWSLVTWLTAALALHVRVPFRTSPRTNALLIVGVFVVAFFTFFGIPFVSTALHKGQI